MKRRTLLRGGPAVFAAGTLGLPGWMAPVFAQPAPSLADWNKAGFDAKTAADAIRHLGSGTPASSRDILIEIQDVIENGARARIEVTSRIPGTQALSIVSDRNPHPLAATFSFANGADPYVSTLIKVAESGTLRVIVNAEGRLYIATRDVKTTIGGCG
jgi:sulfur-oxidizing protein SoxY